MVLFPLRLAAAAFAFRSMPGDDSVKTQHNRTKGNSLTTAKKGVQPSQGQYKSTTACFWATGSAWKQWNNHVVDSQSH
eukprot:m.21464 g.21464  ORF g.21464 m.21464 type:complete len:78 (+) comp12436_c0_seq1:131-364(+)